MRLLTTVIPAIVLVAALGVDSRQVSAAEPAEQGPILLELNAPLLFQPIKGDADNETANDTTPEQNNTTSESKNNDAPKSDTAVTSTTTNKEPSTDQGDSHQTDNDQTGSQKSDKPADAPAALPELSDQMKQLRGVMRRTIAGYAAQPFNTRDNTPANLLQVCTALGCDALVRRDSSGGQRMNAFTCLCWNYPCAGRKMLRLADGNIIARVGQGYQEYPAQFLAALALSRVSAEYPLHVGDNECKVSDLVEYEKTTCRSGEENSFKLIGLARYLPTDSVWKNDLGEDWSISRLLEEELNRSIDKTPAHGTYRLLALAYVVDRRMKRNEPIDGQFERAQNYLTKVRNHALKLQNPDGSWHPSCFTYRGQAGTLVDQLNSTGHMLRWLLLTLPEDQLQDPRIERGVTFLINGLNNSRYRTYVHATSNREIAARLGAVHALAIYDTRLFVPYDKAEKAKQKEAEANKEKESIAAKTTNQS